MASTEKKYMIKNVPQTALYKITLTGGGEINDDLKGMFTSATRASQAIATFNTNSSQSRKVASN